MTTNNSDLLQAVDQALDERSLTWAAQWIEDSLKGEANERVVEFGKNMAMTLRAAGLPDDRRAAVAGPVGDESGWLLEKMHEGNVHYICAENVLQWTDDPNKALRLSRREDAEALTTIVEDCEKIAEHEWPSSNQPPSCAFCDSGLVFNEQEIAALSDLYERTGLRTAQILKHALALYQLHIVRGVDLPLESKLPPAAASSPTPADVQKVADRVNAGVEQMDKSQKVDAAIMQIEFNPAPPESTRVAGEQKCVKCGHLKPYFYKGQCCRDIGPAKICGCICEFAAAPADNDGKD